MGGADDFVALLDSKIRCVVVAQRPIDLGKLEEGNSIFVLQLPEGIRTAMGSRRASGRSLVKVYEFSCGGGECRRVREFEDEEVLERLDLPYQATALGILMPDGKERLVTGVIDEELSSAYAKELGGSVQGDSLIACGHCGRKVLSKDMDGHLYSEHGMMG